MKQFLIVLFLIKSTFCLSKNQEWIEVMVSPDVKVQNLSDQDLQKIFLKKKSFWASHYKVKPLNAPRGTEERKSFRKNVLKLTPSEEVKYWIDMRQREGVSKPLELKGYELRSQFLSTVSGGIGYFLIEKDKFEKFKKDMSRFNLRKIGHGVAVGKK